MASSDARAIPLTGTYTVSGLTSGSFTSDGTRLTAWDLTDHFATRWNNTIQNQTATINDASLFAVGQNLPNPTAAFSVSWDDQLFLAIKGQRQVFGAFNFRLNAMSVPEPSAVLLVLAGLLLLAGYRRRPAGGL
jgi:hypothetical protein